MNISDYKISGPLATLVLDSTESYGVNRLSNNIILVDSVESETSYLFHSSDSEYNKNEFNIRKTRDISKPPRLFYYETEVPFTFNNLAYNIAKDDNSDKIGIIRAGCLLEFHHKVDSINQTHEYVDDILTEAAKRMSRNVGTYPLVEVVDHIEYIEKDGLINKAIRFFKVGGVEEKVYYTKEIDKSNIGFQTVINNSVQKVKFSYYDKEKRNLIKKLSGIIVFRLLLTDAEKNLKVLYTL